MDTVGPRSYGAHALEGDDRHLVVILAGRSEDGMARRSSTSVLLVLGATIPLTVLAGSAGAAGPARGPLGLLAHPSATAPSATDDGDEGGETRELLDRAEQYAAVRTAPAATVSSEAFLAARAQAAALPQAGGAWSELTTKPYDSDAVRFRDPTWSNSSGGSGLVSGRMTALVADGGTVWAGAADGGVWKSTDRGQHWTPTFDDQPGLSIGALAVDPSDHSVWVGTGEANSNADAYSGNGVYRSADGGRSWQLVGGRLDSSLTSRITFDGVGHVYVASSKGLLRRSTADRSGAWTTVLKPDPNPTSSPYRTSWISDVKVRPGSGGTVVTAVLGWRGGTQAADTSYNGFYVSRTSGTQGSFDKVTPAGISGPTGRTSLDYGPDGSLVAVVEDPTDLGMKGVFRSASGAAAGPWALIASEDELAKAPGTATGDPGAQAWYDQYVTVDPKDAKHIYVGLTEVYETSDGGRTFTTIGPYWNFGKACWSADPAKNTCPDTTHADQHAAFVAGDGTAYFANDGGVYSRPASLRKQVRWNDLNATLRTLQYYSVGIGKLPDSPGDAVWGGLQDNGTSLLRPDYDRMVSPFGGDGAQVVVDPQNGNRAVNSYVYLTTARTSNGGISDGTTGSFTTITPTCKTLIDVGTDPRPCDPNPRFIAPYTADQKSPDHWVAGGQLIWDNGDSGWGTTCTRAHCDWTPVHDLGSGAQATAIGVSARTVYAGWCGNGCNPGGSAPFVSGIDTNAGGAWHRVQAKGLPQRIPTSFAIDPRDARHVFVSYGAFSRQWIAGGGVGHVFESTDGGDSWKDVSGTLPDAPVSALRLVGGNLVAGTDVGVFVAPASGGSWSRLGGGLPQAATLALAESPSGDYLVAATHGRGMWRIPLS